MKRFNKVVACALSILMVANPFYVHAADNTHTWKNDNKLISSSIESEKDIVTVKLDIVKDSGITSGQGIVYYDKDELELQWTTSVGYWDMYDINESYENDGRTGVSYAFATYEAPGKTGTMLTLCFKAKNAANGKEVKADSEIIEIYADSESLLAGIDAEKLTNKLEIAPISNPVVSQVVSVVISFKKRIGSIFRGIFG